MRKSSSIRALHDQRMPEAIKQRHWSSLRQLQLDTQRWGQLELVVCGLLYFTVFWQFINSLAFHTLLNNLLIIGSFMVIFVGLLINRREMLQRPGSPAIRLFEWLGLSLAYTCDLALVIILVTGHWSTWFADPSMYALATLVFGAYNIWWLGMIILCRRYNHLNREVQDRLDD